MLLGTPKYLAKTRKFKGSVALICQPAEEVLPSGKDGPGRCPEPLRHLSGICHTQHAWLEVGKFGICYGLILASLDQFDLIVTGNHAAKPH
ncbi:hypothetical protein AAE026_31365 [Bradyrhizobium sp. DN5]|uniref:hypothetical protein n=1 Tax=Bradyrhizobium sp. DN5 TaxID=3056950 RepID=UPI003524276A